MARRNSWLANLASELSKTHPIPGDTWYWYQALENLDKTAAEQLTVFDRLSGGNDARLALLNAALKLANFQEPEDPITKKFHDAVISYHAHTKGTRLPRIRPWAKKYSDAPHFAAPPEARIPLNTILKARNGNIRSPVHELYRYIRGNARLNESKDMLSVVPPLWTSQQGTALNKLVKNGYVKYDPISSVVLVPRDVIRQIDPYYEIYQKTLNELTDTIDKDVEDGYTARHYGMLDLDWEDKDYRSKLNAEQNAVLSKLGPALAKYTDFAKAYMQDRLRQGFPRIAEDLPLEEREQQLAAQQAQLQNVNNLHLFNDANTLGEQYIAMLKAADLISTYLDDRKGWPVKRLSNRARLASLFSEKGLRSLLNNPKRLLKVAQANDLIRSEWHKLNQRPWNQLWWPRANRNREPDPDVPYDLYEAIPNETLGQIGRINQPGRYWAQGDLHSLNNFDALRRQLADHEQIVERNTAQARNRIIQYIAAHPELQQLADQNAARQAEEQRLRQMRGLSYKPNAEDIEEEKLLTPIINFGGNYQSKIKKVLENPRLVELAERPYQYSKDILDALNKAPVPLADAKEWRLVKNRRELYDRSLNHVICVGVPGFSYNDKVLAKKSLIFFNGDHTDLESETGEIALYIDQKTHKIIKATVEQVQGKGNKGHKDESMQALQLIAKTLVGKKATDINNVVEQEGIEYKEGNVRWNEAMADYYQMYNRADDLEQQEDIGFLEAAHNYAHQVLTNEGYRRNDNGEWERYFEPPQQQPQQQVNPYDEYMNYVHEYAMDHHYEGDLADYDDDEGYNYAQERMRDAGYHMDEDGNYLAPDDPRYDDWDEWGNHIDDDADLDEEDFDEDDEGYAEGGFVEPIGNPAYRRLLELLLEDGMTKPSKHLTSLMTRRF